jgi:hypothetical protein
MFSKPFIHRLCIISNVEYTKDTTGTNFMTWMLVLGGVIAKHGSYSLGHAFLEEGLTLGI